MRSSSIFILAYSFTVIGLFLVAYSSYSHTQSFIDQSSVAEGKVIGFVAEGMTDSIVFKPRVQFFSSNNHEVIFTSTVGSNPKKYSEGEKVRVYYQSDYPEVAKLDELFALWGWVYLTAGMGSLFLIIGMVRASFSLTKLRKRYFLKQNGMMISGSVARVKRNHFVTINGENPYQLVLKGKDPSSGKILTFISDNLKKEPRSYLEKSEYSIFVDKRNSDNYFVELS